MNIGAIIVCHLVGDYLLQSDWMALHKTRRWWPAIAHGLTYGLPYLVLTRNPWALLLIVGSHIVIDRYRLARHLCWIKNFIAPRGFNQSWSDCSATGYPNDRPIWMTTWLLIIGDNTAHLLINIAALWWL